MTTDTPPTYDYADARSLPEKDGASVLSPTPTLPMGRRAVDAGGVPLTLNVYKAGKAGKQAFGNDDIVTGDDKDRTLYYLAFPTPRNHFTLHRNDKDGPVVSEIKTGTLASEFVVTQANGWSTKISWPSVLAGNFDFMGPDGTSKYRWKSFGRVSMDFTLTNLANEDIVATWRRTGMSAKKGGQLLISQIYIAEVDLILATALSVEEWCRVQVG